MTVGNMMAAIRSATKRSRNAVGALALAMVLASCAGTDMAGLVTPAAAPEPAPAAPAAVEATPATAPPTRGRAATTEAPAPPAAAPTSGLTPEQINTECWMRADSDRRLRDIDARLAYVKRCAAERTKGR
jgi:hypothetical protein